MNKQGGAITIIFWVIGAVIVWSMFASKLMNEWGQQAIINGQLTGIEALVYGNINLIVGLVFFISILAIGLYGGRE